MLILAAGLIWKNRHSLCVIFNPAQVLLAVRVTGAKVLYRKNYILFHFLI